PHEVAPGERLIHAVDAQRVVRGGAAEVRAPLPATVIRAGPGIDQELEPAERQRESERIGMSMGGDAAIAEGTGVRDQTDLVAGLEVAAEDVIAAARESPAQRRPRARLLDPAEQLPGPRSEQPARLVVQLPGFRLELAAAEQNRPAREERPIGREIGALRQSGYRAVVGVADHRHVAARIHDRSEADEHRGQAQSPDFSTYRSLLA